MSEQPIFEVPEVHHMVDRRPARMVERQAEWDAENTVVKETLIHGDDSITTRETTLAELRQELAEIPVQEGGDLPPPEVIEGLPQPEDTPQGILQEKKMRRQRKERKEAIRPFTEMLVVFNDVQLLDAADQEALGAFLKYVEHNKDRITHLVANGDILDFTAQSVFEKDLGAMNSANDEIEAGQWLFEWLSRTLPDAHKVFIEGNHSARWSNMINEERGNAPWLKSIDEMFGLKDSGWEHLLYGSGQYYKWHDRIFWHGHRSGAKSNIPKLELEDAGVSVTTAHVNRNMYHESVDALGTRKSGITHGGFSKDNLGFMKKANTGWSQGFGVYYWDAKTRTEQAYMVTMAHGHPVFISPEGDVFSGKGWSIPGFERRKR